MIDNTQQAKRISGWEQLESSEMSYWYDATGYEAWMLYLPGCGVGNLKNHTVTEHPDGTITVTPSILVTAHDQGKKTVRHGYLTRGVWREC